MSKTRISFTIKRGCEVMREYIKERILEEARYIVEHEATVRQTAKAFMSSKSTIHTAVTKWNVIFG